MPEFSLVESIYSCVNNFSFTGHQQNHAYLYGYDIKNGIYGDYLFT